MRRLQCVCTWKLKHRHTQKVFSLDFSTPRKLWRIFCLYAIMRIENIKANAFLRTKIKEGKGTNYFRDIRKMAEHFLTCSLILIICVYVVMLQSYMTLVYNTITFWYSWLSKKFDFRWQWISGKTQIQLLSIQ